MSKVREYSYKIKGLKGVDSAIVEQIHDEFKKVNGVMGINVKIEEESIEYVLDEWSSDYDAFSKLSEICDNHSLELIFDDDEVITSDVLEEDVTPTAEEVIEEEKPQIKDKLTKGDFIEKAIILILAIGFTVAGLCLSKRPNVQPWILMLGFTVASYEILYEVIVKLTDKKYILEELIVFGGALILTYQGEMASSAVIMLLYSILNFSVTYARHRVALKKEKLQGLIEESQDENERAELKSTLEFIENSQNVISSKTAKINSLRLAFNLSALIIAFLLVFIPPLFTIKLYWITLKSKWLYVGASTLILCGFGEVLFSFAHAEFNALINARRNGVVISDINAFTNLASVKNVCFDRSGVLTANSKVVSLDGDEECKILALSALNGLNDHVARAINKFCAEISPKATENVEYTFNMGVSCSIDKSKVLVGNKKFLKDNGVAVEDGKDAISYLYVAKNGSLIGKFILESEILSDSFGAVAELRNDLDINVEILSADSGAVVTDLKKQLKANHAVAGASPKFKADRVNKQNAVFVGEELNDEQTLKLVDKSITFGESGKIAVKTKSVRKVPLILKLAKRTAKTAKANFTLALISKIILYASTVLLKLFAGINAIWWIFAIDVLIRLIAVIRAILNETEVA